jgi:hypothetical protein
MLEYTRQYRIREGVAEERIDEGSQELKGHASARALV